MISNTPITSNGSAGGGKGSLAYVIWISLVAAMGGLLFGYDWVVIGGAEPFYEAYFDLTDPYLIGWAMSAALIGCLLGSIISGGLSDKFGRKKLLLTAAVLFAVSSVFTGLAATFPLFVVWRMIGGVAIGMASNLSPMYIAEIAPAALRGRLVAMNQLTIVIGILVAQIANLMIADQVDPQLDQQAQVQVARAAGYDRKLQEVTLEKASQLEADLASLTNDLSRVSFIKAALNRPSVFSAGTNNYTNQFWVINRQGTIIRVAAAPELEGRQKAGQESLARQLRAMAPTNGLVFLKAPRSEPGADQPSPRLVCASALEGADAYLLCAGLFQDDLAVRKEKLRMIRGTRNGATGWRWMFAAVAIPSLLFLICSIFVPESPRWLVKNGRDEAARRILSRIGGPAHADKEVTDIKATLAAQEIQHVRFGDLLETKMLKILLVGCALAVLQQWSGINVLFNYATEIFQEAGYGVSDSLLFIVITGSVNLLFTLIAMGSVDRWGRRRLMLIGCAGIGVSHLLMGLAYNHQLTGLFVLLFALAAIGWYAMSLAPVTWVLISEIFPNRIRGAAVSVAVSALWIACFILTFTFPLLKKSLGMANTFWIYAAICACGFIFILKQVPETKGKTLEQIERELVD
jgi:MFS family permease